MPFAGGVPRRSGHGRSRPAGASRRPRRRTREGVVGAARGRITVQSPGEVDAEDDAHPPLHGIVEALEVHREVVETQRRLEVDVDGPARRTVATALAQWTPD